LTIQRHRQYWSLDTEGELKNGYLETQATLCTRHRRGNQEWTVQRHRQHWALDTEEVIKKWTIQRHGQHWAPDTEGAMKNGQSRNTGNIEHKTQKGKSRMDNPETQATVSTRHRRGNEEWTIQKLLPVSLDCPFLITLLCLVPTFACVSGLSILDFPFCV
jgi:hypothetical protein